MSRRVHPPPSQGRGYSVRGVISRGAGRGSSGRSKARRRSDSKSLGAAFVPVGGPVAAARPPVAGAVPVAPADAAVDAARVGSAFNCTTGVAIRALATSVSRPTWLCHHPAHAMAPCQKLVYVELKMMPVL